MTQQAHLMPRQPVPALDCETLANQTGGGGRWSLAAQQPERFTMIVFYRGLHCPICANYLRDLERKLDDFAKQGVEVIAVSGDDEERARKTREDWGLEKLTLGYGVDLDRARAWGLYISAGIGKTSVGIEEPAFFFEPGLFLVRSDGSLYFGSIQTMPFARPGFGELLKALEFVNAKGYPARGEVVDHRAAAE